METNQQPHQQNRQDAILQGLKACEINYKAHTSKHGATTEQEFQLWLSELQDLSPNKIAQSFKLHLHNSAFFPTIADIRNAIHEHRTARAITRASDEWNTDVKALPAPEPTKGIPPKAMNRLKKLKQQAAEDPQVKKAMQRKEAALNIRDSYNGSQPRLRNQNRREHIPMSQDQLDRIFYGDNYGSKH